MVAPAHKRKAAAPALEAAGTKLSHTCKRPQPDSQTEPTPRPPPDTTVECRQQRQQQRKCTPAKRPGQSQQQCQQPQLSAAETQPQKVLGATDAAATTALPAAPGKPKRAPTVFEARLYEMCKRIPKGKVATYGLMAQALNSAPRAVGQALRRNPFAPVVPCHRVIAASLELGGFSGQWGEGCENVKKKRRLLEEEGVAFKGKVLANTDYLVSVNVLRGGQ